MAEHTAGASPLARQSATPMAARDASGVIWSVSDNDDKVLQRWNGDAWQKTDFSPLPDARVVALEKRADGNVVALWNQASKNGGSTAEYRLSVHRGAVSRPWQKFSSKASPLQFLAGPTHDFWLVGEGRDFYRAGEGEEIRKLFVLPDAALEKPRPKAGQTSSGSFARPLFDSVVDGAGRSWFWNNVWKNEDNALRLSGFLVAESGSSAHPVKSTPQVRFTVRRTLPGLPRAPLPPLQAVTRGGANGLFVSLRGAGVFEVRTDSLRATRVAEPFRGAFGIVRQLWVSRRGKTSDLYVVAGSTASDNDETNNLADQDYSVHRNSLWRRRAGKWKRLIAGVDKHGYDEIQASRSWLQTPEGLWLGANGDGLWFVGNDDRAHLVGWQRGFNLPLRQSIFPLPNPKPNSNNAAPDAFLVTGSDGTTVVPGFAPLSKETGAAGVSTFRAYLAPIADANSHLWAVLNLRDHALHEWDGNAWKKHPAPVGYKLSNGYEMALDARGRVWIPSDTREGQSAVFDPKTKTWQVFPTYAAALLANRASGLPIAQRSINREGRGPSSLPRRGAGGRLCYLSAARKIYLFDGRNWRSWKRRDIEKNHEEEEFDNPPFFGSRHQLCVQLHEMVYELTFTEGKTLWKSTRREKDPDYAARHLDVTYFGNSGEAPDIPLNGSGPDAVEENASWDDGLRDSEGTLWLLHHRALYRAPLAPLPRAAHLVLSAGQNQPFLDGRELREVVSDARGNVFLGTPGEWVMVRLDAPIPDTSLQLQPQGSGSFLVHLKAAFQKPPSKNLASETSGWVSWRLDGNGWSAPTHRNSIALDSLSPGRHALEVIAISAAGRPDPTPARLVWQVAADSPARLAQFVAQLRDPDFARRETAVRALARQSATSLPKLRAALETARRRDQAKPGSEADTLWWLQAAIQEAEVR